MRVGAVLLGNAVVLELDEEAVASEDVLEPAPGLLARGVETSVVIMAWRHVAHPGSRWWRYEPLVNAPTRSSPVDLAACGSSPRRYERDDSWMRLR